MASETLKVIVRLCTPIFNNVIKDVSLLIKDVLLLPSDIKLL